MCVQAPLCLCSVRQKASVPPSYRIITFGTSESTLKISSGLKIPWQVLTKVWCYILSVPSTFIALTAMLLMPGQNKSHVVGSGTKQKPCCWCWFFDTTYLPRVRGSGGHGGKTLPKAQRIQDINYFDSINTHPCLSSNFYLLKLQEIIDSAICSGIFSEGMSYDYEGRWSA